MTGFAGRKPFGLLQVFIALFFVLQLAVSAPHREKREAGPSCANEVTTNSKLTYEIGKTYNYNFESEIVTQIVGGSDEDSRLKIKGQAALGVLSSCEYILTLTNLDLDSPSQQAPLNAGSIKFIYQNGKIDSESVTLQAGDSVWSANIKRAIVSLFQNHALEESSISNLVYRESDVTGNDCLTKYSVNGTKYVKTKDLNLCSKRDGGVWIAQGIKYKNPRGIQSDESIKSSQTCTQDWTLGKLQSVKCTETHKLEILNPDGGGAQTKVATSLELLGEQSGNPSAGSFKGSDPVGIEFDHSDESEKNLNQANAARKTLGELCTEVKGGILGPRVSSLYLNLIKKIGRTSVNDLRAIYADITSNKICPGGEESEKVKKIFQDAAATAGTSTAIEYTAKLYDSLDKKAQSMFQLAAMFAKYPGEPALESVAPLLTGGDSQLLLAASGLAHQYCLLKNPKCGTSAAYNSISDGIASHAKANCLAQDQAGIKKAISALQALGNLDSLSKNAVDAISFCLNSATEERVLAHALQSFRRDSCQESLKEKARSVLSSTTASSDIKIHAYLAIANCLNEQDAAFISTAISGPSNQIYWFIASHRHNRLHTSSQRKATSKAKRAFNLIKITPTTAKSDARKYSSNIDMGFFDQKENIGATLDANIIYSKDSFIPRTVSGDLTFDIWGNSYDLVEVGVNLADYEKVAEKLFKKTPSEDKDAGTDLALQRPKREVAQPNFQQKDVEFLQHSTKVNTLHKTNGVTDLYIRVLGTTVGVDSVELDEVLKEGAQASETLYERIKKGLLGSKLDLTEGLNFLNDEIIVPTISGFPLTIYLESTAVVSLKLDAEYNKGSSLKSRITPSGSIHTRGKMLTGAGPVKTGLQIEANIHSASDLALELTIVPGKTNGFSCDAKISIPQDKTHILEIRSDLYWVKRSGNDSPPVKTAVKSKLPQNIDVDNYCLDSISKYFGLKFCAVVKLPQLGGGDIPVFPLTGPSIVSVTAEKSDPSIKDYTLQLKINTEENADLHLSLVVDTPGSTTNRRIVLTATGTSDPASKEKNLDVLIESPWKKLKGTGKYTKAPKGQGVTTRTLTFDMKDDAGAPLFTSKLAGDYSDNSYDPLNLSLDLDAKYGLQGQHSLTINTKYDHKTSADLLLETKVTSSRLPPLNFDLKWDRTFSSELIKLNLAINQGLGAQKNTISLNSLTNLDANGIKTSTDLKVVIPEKNLEISYSGKADGNKVTRKASGTSDFNVVGIVQSNSKFDIDVGDGSFNLDATASAGSKKLILKSSGGKVAGSEPNREYKLQLNVEPKLFDLDVKTTVRFAKTGFSEKVQIETTATTSLIPTPVSTTIEIVKDPPTNGLKLSAQLNRGNDRVISSSYQRGKSIGKTTIILENFVQNIVNGKIELGSSDDGLTSSTDVTIIPIGRRIKLSGNLLFSQTPDSLNIHSDVDVNLNFDKEPKGGFSISSDTTFKQASSSISIRNTITLSETPYKINLDVTPGNQLFNEEHSWKLSYQSGQNKEHTIGFQLRVDNTDTAKKLTVGAQLDLVSVPDAPKEINLEIGVTKLDLINFYFDSLSRLKVTPNGKSPQILEIEISTTPTPTGRSIRLEVRDDVIFLIGIDASGEIGSDGVRVKYERSKLGKKKILVQLGFINTLVGKQSQISSTAIVDKDFNSAGPTYEFKGSYLYRFDSLWDFEVTETYSLVDRSNISSIYSFDTSSAMKTSSTDFLLKTSQGIKIPGVKDETVDFELSGKRDGNKFSGLIDMKLTNNSVVVQIAKIAASISPGFPGDSELTLSLALPPVVKYRNIELQIKQDEVTKGQSYTNLINAKINEIEIQLTTKLELGSRQSLDFALKLNKDPVRKLFMAYTDSPQGPTVDASLRWGDDSQVISTSGKVIPVGQGWDVELDFNSPALPNKKWELKISRRVETLKRSLNINLDNEESKQNLKFGVEKTMEEDGSRKYVLNLNSKLTLPALRGLLQDQKGQIVLDINKKAFDPSREKNGTQVKLDANLGTLSFGFNVKKSDLEGKLSISLCPGTGCTTGDIQILQAADSFQASSIVVRNGIKVGMSAENKKSASGKGCETTAKIFYPLGAEQKELGVKVYSDDGEESDLDHSTKDISASPNSVRKYGVDVTLGPRTISAQVAQGSWDSAAADADALELHIWLDKAREPTKVLSLSLANLMASKGKQGRDISVVLSHPDFQKDHKIKTTYRFDSATRNLFDITTQFDIFKTSADALIFNTNVKQDTVADSAIFEIGWSMKSEGQGLSWILLCNKIKIDGADSKASCQFDGKSATRGDRNFKFEFSADIKSLNIELVDNEGILFNFKSVPNPKGIGGIFSSLEYMTSIQIPGMTEAWVREIRGNENPTGIAYRGYGSSYPPNKYSEAYIGQYEKRKFGGGARSNDGSTISDLFKYSISLKPPGPDTIQIDWNKENIQKFLSDLNARSDIVSEGLIDFIRKRGNNNAVCLQQIATGLKNALPDPSPLIGRINTVVNELLQEGDGASQGLVALASRAKRAVGDDTRIQTSLSALTESIVKTLASLAQTRRDVVNKVKDLLDTISQLPPTQAVLDTLKEPLKGIIKGALEKAAELNVLAQGLEKGKIAKFILPQIRQSILDIFQDAYDEDVQSLNDAFPYPAMKQLLNSIPDYAETAILKPNETTTTARDDMSEKLDRAVIEILSKTFSADFQKGSIVSNIPLTKILGLAKSRDDKLHDHDHQEYPSLGPLDLVYLLVEPNKVFPPADAVGIVLGGTHFQTFDGILKPFGAACQYLLASDFVDNSFTVAVDIQKRGANSTQALIVNDNNNNVVIISGSPTIYVNGKISEPTKIGPFTIKQDNKWTIVRGTMGLKVKCLRSEDKQLCEVKASGYNHGKLRGILGLFNNEAYDDKTIPDGTQSESTANFVKSWQLNQDCRGQKINTYLLDHDYKKYVKILDNENLNAVKTITK